MSDQWTRASDGSIGVFPGETGLVGSPNAGGFWAMWIPRPGITYSAFYFGREITLKNNGDGTYDMTLGGVTKRYRYATRWQTNAIYDAAGNVIASPDAASVPGDPSSIYFQPGYTEGANTSSGLVQQTGSGTTPVNTSNIMSSASNRTRSSDGRTDVWAGDSGMVGIFNPTRQAWAIFVPPPGIDYLSYYWGADIAIRNNGDGTYWLDADGVKAKRRYAPQWQVGVFYDRNGRQVANADSAVATGDPADIFFVPGQVAPDAVVTQGQSVTPVVQQPQYAVMPATSPNQPGTAPPQSLPPQVVYTGANITPNGPGSAEFPTTPMTGPDGGAEGSGNGKLLALAAVAALALLS